MNSCDLNSLKNFPVNKELYSLELQDNPFPATELVHLKDLTNLKSLDLSGNKIHDVDCLAPLAKSLKKLERIDLEETPLSEQEDYRALVFKLFPSLNIVDGQDKEGNELDYTSDEGDNSEDSEGDEESDSQDDDESGSDEDDDEDEDDEDEDEEDEDEEEN